MELDLNVDIVKKPIFLVNIPKAKREVPVKAMFNY